jgi:hypothetical protein
MYVRNKRSVAYWLLRAERVFAVDACGVPAGAMTSLSSADGRHTGLLESVVEVFMVLMNECIQKESPAHVLWARSAENNSNTLQ